MFNEIKNKIYTYFKDEMSYRYPEDFPLEDGFCEKIFWRKSRDEQPQKPYIVLDDVIKTKINKAHEKYKLDGKTYQRENWRMVVTFAVYNQGTEGDFAEADAKALDYIEAIELLFNSIETFEALQNNGIIVNEKEVSNIRDLSSFEQTNYSYRYEIDITFDFDKIIEPKTHGISEGVKTDIEVKDSNLKIEEEFYKGD